MTPNANKAVVRRLLEDYFNQRDEEVWDQLVRDDVVIHGAQGDLQGSEAAKTLYRGLWAAFQPWQATVEEIIAEREAVVVRLIERGTMVGSLSGASAKFRPLSGASRRPSGDAVGADGDAPR
jgi:ketosteroid isomerase-like protein